jgi:hypothetical protein
MCAEDGGENNHFILAARGLLQLVYFVLGYERTSIDILQPHLKDVSTIVPYGLLDTNQQQHLIMVAVLWIRDPVPF